MKKVLLPLLVIAAAAAVALFLIRRTAPHRARAAELVPPETVLFAHVPDVRDTVFRFTQTELYQLFQEPEVQAFLEKPRTSAPQSVELQTRFEKLVRTSPREAFFAVTSIDGATPKIVAGFSYSGSRRNAEELLAEPRAAMKRARPAGKSDLVSYGGAEIETFTDKELTVADTFHGNWYLIANDLELLQRTLDRAGGKHDGAPALAQGELFKRATAPLPENRAAFVFAQLGTVTDRLVALLAATGQPAMKEVQQLKSVQAISACTKLDGAQFRDTIFVLAPGTVEEPPLPRHSLALSSPGTLFYYAAALPKQLELPPSALATAALVVPGFDALNRTLSQKGLALSDLTQAFGPEVGTVVDWPAQAMQPSFVLAFDVRDPEKARGFLEVITGGALGSPAWTQSEENGAVLYSLPQEGLSLTRPTLSLSDKFLILGFSQESVSGALARLGAGGATLSGTPTYAAAEKTVSPATSAYGYLDLRSLFERAYGTFRPLLAMSLAFMPDASRHIDVAKLPSTEAISKHLGPIVFSQSASSEGLKIESTGTVTFNQAVAGVLAGSVGMAMPALKNLAGNQPLDPLKLLPLPKPGDAPKNEAPPQEAPSADATPDSPTPPPAEPAPAPQ